MKRAILMARSSHRLVLCAAIVVLAACSPDVHLGSRCERSSECPAPLVCGQGRCREECREHRDCPLGGRCLFGAGALGTCSLAVDACDDTLPCGEGLECMAGQCFDRCSDTCPAGGVCRDGVCRRDDEGTDAGAGDAGAADAGAPPYAPHRSCLSDASCDASEICISEHGSVPACRRACSASTECADIPGSLCRRFGTPSGARNACTIACDPFTADGCTSPDACDLYGAQTTEGTYVAHLECRVVTGTAGHEGECGPAGAYEPLLCTAGHSCLYGDAATDASRCLQLCAQTGTGPACPAGAVCVGRGGAVVRLGSTVIGWCVPSA